MTKNNKLPQLQFVINHLIGAYNNYVIENKPFNYCLIIYFGGETNILGDTEFNDFYSIEFYDSDVLDFIYHRFFENSDVKIFKYLNTGVLDYLRSHGYKVPQITKTNSINSCNLNSDLKARAKAKFKKYNYYMNLHGYQPFYNNEIVFDYFLSEFNPYIIKELIKVKNLSSSIALILYVLICNYIDNNITIGAIDWTNLKYEPYVELINDVDYCKNDTIVKEKFLEYINNLS